MGGKSGEIAPFDHITFFSSSLRPQLTPPTLD